MIRAAIEFMTIKSLIAFFAVELLQRWPLSRKSPSISNVLVCKFWRNYMRSKCINMVGIHTSIEINKLFSLGTVIGRWGKLEQAVTFWARFRIFNLIIGSFVRSIVEGSTFFFISRLIRLYRTYHQTHDYKHWHHWDSPNALEKHSKSVPPYIVVNFGYMFQWSREWAFFFSEIFLVSYIFVQR